ncbi:MAG TPA: type II secretion system protein [Desulfuromonadaceae bacterium]
MNRHGFSLIELLVVIVLIGIVLTIATLNFSSMNRKAGIERETRELLTDLNTARLDSVYRKQRHAIIFQPNSYIMKRYSSQDESDQYGGDTTTGIVLSKTLPYQITKESGSSLADYPTVFDIRGFVSNVGGNFTIRVNPSYSGAAFDCIVISVGRTNIGTMQGGSCVQQ